jgi:hypothetical protein
MDMDKDTTNRRGLLLEGGNGGVALDAMLVVVKEER